MKRTRFKNATTTTDQRVARLYYDGAYRTAILISRGRQYTQALVLVPVGVKVVRFGNREADKAPGVLYRGADYPVPRAKQLYRRAAKRGPTTKTARAMLRG